MIQQKDLARFKRFASSGGIGQAVNLTKGQAIKSDVAAMMASFSACMDDDADYVAGGVQSLTNAITSLSGELTDAHGKLDAWNGYIALAMKPEELNTVAMGVEIYRLLESIPNDTPAPSLQPILSKSELIALENAVRPVKAKEASIVSLMGQINGILAKPSDSGGSDSGGGSAKPSLPQHLKNQAATLTNELRSLIGTMATPAGVIGTMTTSAHAERAIAHTYFKKAVDFTIGENQLNNPAIMDAVKEVYPLD